MTRDFEVCYSTIASNIKKLRKFHDLTQVEMAKLLDIEPQYYARLERGDDPDRKFTLEKVIIVCSIFRVTPNDIITKLPNVTPITERNYRYSIESMLKDLSQEQLEKIYKEISSYDNRRNHAENCGS